MFIIFFSILPSDPEGDKTFVKNIIESVSRSGGKGAKPKSEPKSAVEDATSTSFTLDESKQTVKNAKTVHSKTSITESQKETQTLLSNSSKATSNLLIYGISGAVMAIILYFAYKYKF